MPPDEQALTAAREIHGHNESLEWERLDTCGFCNRYAALLTRFAAEAVAEYRATQQKNMIPMEQRQTVEQYDEGSDD